MANADCCHSCGRFTVKGEMQRAEQYRARPIYGTDFSQPLSTIIEAIRSDIAKLRGRLDDIAFAYPVMKERVEPANGALTCVLVSLYSVHKEMLECEQLRAHHV